MSKSVSGSSREGGKEMQLCSLGKNVRWQIDQSDAKLVPFATFRNATRRNCHTFPCDFSKFAQFSFHFCFLFPVFACCCSLLVSISWINQREFTIYNSQFSCNLQIELGRGTVRIWLLFKGGVVSISHSHSYCYHYKAAKALAWEVVGVAFKMHINGVALITRPRFTLLHKDERLKRLCGWPGPGPNATRVQHEQQVEYIVATCGYLPLPLALSPLSQCTYLRNIKTQSPSAIPAHKNGCKNGKQ